VLEEEESKLSKSFWLSDSETATDTPMPFPGSMRFTKQSSFTVRSRVNSRGEPRPSQSGIGGFDKHSVGADVAAWFPRSDRGKPHSISRSARNE